MREEENSFHDIFVQQSTAKYSPQASSHTPPSISTGFHIQHGSNSTAKRLRYCICHEKASRFCPDCPYQPQLCQTLVKSCHELWHSDQYQSPRAAWFLHASKDPPHQWPAMSASLRLSEEDHLAASTSADIEEATKDKIS